MKKVKIIANYLPQFHCIPENDKWWGKGFTDWESVKNAKSLFDNHIQPKIPLNNNYYSLDNKESIEWQANLARQYGIYGFAIYHYWFSSDLQLLTKPAEILLENKNIDINYFFLWDNSTWKRTWSNVKHANDWAPNFDNDKDKGSDNSNGVLAELKYGTETDWEIHFNYLLQFFKDSRYIKIDGKPVFGFFQPNIDFETISKMASYWNTLAKENGFNGIYCMTRDNYFGLNLPKKFEYTPLVPTTKTSYAQYKIKDIIAKTKGSIRFYDYKKCWNTILKQAKKSDKSTMLSGFVSFDDTPRRGMNGRIIADGNPRLFEEYLTKLIKISANQDKDYLLLTAWNEWSEGAYLEPDEQHGYQYLDAVKNALEKGNNLC